MCLGVFNGRVVRDTTASGLELLREMEGKCMYYFSGWWSYSFCYQKQIKQFLLLLNLAIFLVRCIMVVVCYTWDLAEESPVLEYQSQASPSANDQNNPQVYMGKAKADSTDRPEDVNLSSTLLFSLFVVLWSSFVTRGIWQRSRRSSSIISSFGQQIVVWNSYVKWKGNACTISLAGGPTPSVIRSFPCSLYYGRRSLHVGSGRGVADPRVSFLRR
jgi:hypothetical protein